MASVAAVDVCGQISETSLSVLTSDTSQLSNQNACNQQPAMIGLGFTGTIAIIMTLLTIALGGILTYYLRKSVPCPWSKKRIKKYLQDENTKAKGSENVVVDDELQMYKYSGVEN